MEDACNCETVPQRDQLNVPQVTANVVPLLPKSWFVVVLIGWKRDSGKKSRPFKSFLSGTLMRCVAGKRKWQLTSKRSARSFINRREYQRL